jgi:hypothetical protein
MSDLRGQVARAIATPMAEALGISADEVLRVFRRTIELDADAAIAVVIEELAQRAENNGDNIIIISTHPVTDDSGTIYTLADWLRAQRERLHE